MCLTSGVTSGDGRKRKGGHRCAVCRRCCFGFQYEREAKEYLGQLKQRLQAFGLAIHPEKTRLIRFGRFAMSQRAVRGEGKPETFDFSRFYALLHNLQTGRLQAGSKDIEQEIDQTNSGSEARTAATYAFASDRKPGVA